MPDVSSSPSRGMRTYRFVNTGSRTSDPAVIQYNRSPKTHGGLVKQTYSTWVLLHPSPIARKWHITGESRNIPRTEAISNLVTAYFTYDDLPLLPTVDQDPRLCKIIVPLGLYWSGKKRHRSEGDRSSTLGPTLPSMSPGKIRCESNPKKSGVRLAEDERVIRMLNGHFLGR
jgi:hypothetical protein